MRWPFPCFPPVFCMQNSSLHLSTYGNPMKSLWHRHHPMKSPFCTKFPITIWPVKLLGFLGSFRFFSTHRQAIGPPTFGRSWTRCHGVRWYNPEEKHWACNGTGRQDIISVFGVVHAARMFELTSLLCFFIWTWMVLVQPNPVSSFLIYVDVFPHLPDECC